MLKNRQGPKRKLIFQPSFFRGYVKFWGCNWEIPFLPLVMEVENGCISNISFELSFGWVPFKMGPSEVFWTSEKQLFPKLLFHRDSRNVWKQVLLCFHVHNLLWYQVRLYTSLPFLKRTTRVSNNGHVDIILYTVYSNNYSNNYSFIHNSSKKQSWRKTWSFLHLGFPAVSDATICRTLNLKRPSLGTVCLRPRPAPNGAPKWARVQKTIIRIDYGSLISVSPYMIMITCYIIA